MTELQREMKQLRKTSEHQTSVIDETSAKMRSKLKLEDEVGKLASDVVFLKETTSVQVKFSSLWPKCTTRL